jgi:3-methyladenine DNA glycosylase AlkD
VPKPHAAPTAPPTLADVRAELRARASPERAIGSLRFFRTGPGDYGEGDRFLGLTVPQLRSIARGARALTLADALVLLESEWHEERLLALLLLVDHYERGDAAARAAITTAYLAHTALINNWDLVDASAEYIVGPTVRPSDLRLLVRLTKSASVWERRIAMIATFHHTKQGELRPALQIAERLLDDPHDLIHKAVGWMLREVAKRDQAVVEAFLRAHYDRLPRTTLRYAIERFDEPLRRAYLTNR